MIPVAVLGTIIIVALAESGTARLIGVGYGIAGIGLYSASAAAHFKVWEPARLHKLFMLDQSMIMVYITPRPHRSPMRLAVGLVLRSFSACSR